MLYDPLPQRTTEYRTIMTDQFLQANGLKLCYDEFGEPGNPAMLLIMGLGTQMIAWTEEFCQKLADQGYRVVRFDNRDVGLSEKIEADPPSMLSLLGNRLFKRPISTPYTLNDMAADAIGVLDALEISKAHIIGASMGGMIAQIIAAKYPERTLSLTSIMSTSGARHLPQASSKITALMLRRRADTEEQRLKNSIALWRVIGSPAYQPSEEDLKARILRAYRRNYCPKGYLRQVGAIAASGDRTALLGKISVRTVVIHGAADLLVPLAGGEHTASLIPYAQLRVYEGMGHDVPQPLYDRIISDIVSVAAAPQ